jgi:integrase
MSVHFDKKRRRWMFDFSRRIDGIRYRSTKLLPQGWSRNQAETYARTKSASYYAQATGIEKPRLALAGAVKLYLDHRCPELRNGKKAAQDLAHLVDEIEREWLDGVADLATRYTIAHRGKLAPGTIRNRLAYLKAAVRYAYRAHGYGDRNYAERMVLPAANNERQVYAKLPELSKLWKAFPDTEAAALFKAAFYMGLRWRAELLPRVPGDVIRNGKDTWLMIGKTKNGLPVMKPVHPAALPCLKYLPWTHGEQWFYAQWDAARKAVDRPELNPHDLRHSLASAIRAQGGTLEDVQGALHQVSRQSAQRYAHLYPERLQAVLFGVGGRKVTIQALRGRPWQRSQRLGRGGV